MPLASNVYSYIDAHDSTLAVGCLKSDHLEIRRRHFLMYSCKDMCAEVGWVHVVDHERHEFRHGCFFIVSEYTKSLAGVQAIHSNSFSTSVKKLIVTFVLAKVVSDLSGVCLLDLQEYFLQDRGSFDF